MNVLGIPPESWFPVVTFTIGVVLQAIFDAVRDRRAGQRAREARYEQRLDSFHLKRVEFQRATLLELQEKIAQLARFTAQSNHLDVVANRTGGAWQKQRLPEDVSEGFRRTQAEVNLLRVRVRDEGIRQAVDALSTACTNTVFSQTEASADRSLSEMSALVNEANERIGILLRCLDDNEDRLLGGTSIGKSDQM